MNFKNALKSEISTDFLSDPMLEENFSNTITIPQKYT